MKHSFCLPIPPSVNHCWRFTSRGVFRKSKYLIWLQNAQIAADVQKVPKCTGPVAVSITIHPGNGWNPVRDIDNVFKCVLDFLKPGRHRDFGYITGDDCRTLQRLFVTVGKQEPEAFIRVRIKNIRHPVEIKTKTQIARESRKPRKKTKQVENGTGY